MARVRLSILLLILAAAVAVLIGKIHRLPPPAADRASAARPVAASPSARAQPYRSPAMPEDPPSPDGSTMLTANPLRQPPPAGTGCVPLVWRDDVQDPSATPK